MRMKQKNGLYMALFALLMVLLFVPVIQQIWRPFSIRRLDGATVKTEKPTLTYDCYKDMSYQAQLEKYVAENFGFHESVIRLYNQYLWMFRKTYAFDVTIGKDKWLYPKKCVQDHYRQVSYEAENVNDDASLKMKLDKDIERLKKVQDMLEQRGTKMFLLICPAKDVIYPEHLPTNGNFVMGDALRAVEYVPNALAEHGINYVDMCDWFLKIKDTVSYPLFPMRAMHWSDIACIHAADSVIRYMEQLTGKNMPNLKIGPMYPDETVYPDGDLEQSMNLLWGIRPPFQNYYAKVETDADSTAQKLNLLTIGDSFFKNWNYTLPMKDVFNAYPYYFYYSTVYFDPDHSHVSQVNLMEELDRADIVMLSYSATQLYEINRGFLSQALLQLSAKHPSNLDEILKDIKQTMESNEPWFALLKEKAEKQGKPLEQVMDEDARYVFYQNPEKYVMNAALEQIKRNIRNNPEWYESQLQKAKQTGKDIEQVMDEDALYILNQEPEKYF